MASSLCFDSLISLIFPMIFFVLSFIIHTFALPPHPISHLFLPLEIRMSSDVLGYLLFSFSQCLCTCRSSPHSLSSTTPSTWGRDSRTSPVQHGSSLFSHTFALTYNLTPTFASHTHMQTVSSLLPFPFLSFFRSYNLVLFLYFLLLSFSLQRPYNSHSLTLYLCLSLTLFLSPSLLP